jgi:hypothetical protein
LEQLVIDTVDPNAIVETDRHVEGKPLKINKWIYRRVAFLRSFKETLEKGASLGHYQGDIAIHPEAFSLSSLDVYRPRVYFLIVGLFKRVAATFRLRLVESFQGDVPIVGAEVLDTIP